MKYTLVVQWMGEQATTNASGRTFQEILQLLEGIYGTALNESVVSIDVKAENYDFSRDPSPVRANTTDGYWAGNVNHRLA